MRISDWSSDVCSSDLVIVNVLRGLSMRHVVEARDGYGALEELRATPIDLILMDWEMEGMNGMTLLQTIRSGRRGINPMTRSEERRVGNECGSPWRSGWSPES